MQVLQITIQINPNPELTFLLNPSGTYDSFNYYEFTYFGTTYYVYHTPAVGGNWFINETLGAAFGFIAELKGNDAQCPEATLTSSNAWLPNDPDLLTLDTECKGADGLTCDIEDRDFFEFKSIKLPKVCVDEDRGFTDCCCEYMVLGSTSSNSWENDYTSAWVKLSDPTDGYSFELYKNGVLANYQPTAQVFPNEPNAYFVTIDWYDVLLADGEGCFELKVGYEISGIVGNYTWGVYKLAAYSIQNAINTARIRAEFSGYHEIEGINFTGSGIESTFRFYGYIGNRQPNTEIDNIIYSNREMKRVIRENLNSYEILVDPSHKCVTEPLIDLFLLSENKLYISDYNAHNHNYCIDDLPVIVKEAPELTYYDFSRKASIRCIVEDKFKNKRTYY
jgi:hypothetical protein